MVYYDYESELYLAFYHEPHDFDWGKAYLLSLPTDELKEKYREYTEMLEKWRNKEPSKKRGHKDEYRMWIQHTHDMRDLLNEIAEELRSR